MVDIVHQRHAHTLAQGQQASRCKTAIVVFQCQPVENAATEEREPSLESLQCRVRTAGSATSVQHDNVSANHLRNRRLMLQLLDSRSYHRFTLRVEHHEL